MQKRRVTQRQDIVLRLYQHLDLCTAEDDALGSAHGLAIHDFKVGIARAVLEKTAARLIEDDSIYAPDLPFFGKDHVDSEPRAKPRRVEILDYDESYSQQADAYQPVNRQRMAERISDVEERNADALGDRAIHLVHLIASQHSTAQKAPPCSSAAASSSDGFRLQSSYRAALKPPTRRNRLSSSGFQPNESR